MATLRAGGGGWGCFPKAAPGNPDSQHILRLRPPATAAVTAGRGSCRRKGRVWLLPDEGSGP